MSEEKIDKPDVSSVIVFIVLYVAFPMLVTSGVYFIGGIGATLIVAGIFVAVIGCIFAWAIDKNKKGKENKVYQ